MRVAILAIPGVQMLDLAGPMDVFSEANAVMRDADAYSVQIVDAEGPDCDQPLRLRGGDKFSRSAQTGPYLDR